MIHEEVLNNKVTGLSTAHHLLRKFQVACSANNHHTRPINANTFTTRKNNEDSKSMLSLLPCQIIAAVAAARHCIAFSNGPESHARCFEEPIAVSFIVPHSPLITLDADLSRASSNYYHLLNSCSSNNPFKCCLAPECVQCQFHCHESSQVAFTYYLFCPKLSQIKRSDE